MTLIDLLSFFFLEFLSTVVTLMVAEDFLVTFLAVRVSFVTPLLFAFPTLTVTVLALEEETDTFFLAEPFTETFAVTVFFCPPLSVTFEGETLRDFTYFLGGGGCASFAQRRCRKDGKYHQKRKGERQSSFND